MSELGQHATFRTLSKMSAPGGEAEEIGQKADIARNHFTAAQKKI